MESKPTNIQSISAVENVITPHAHDILCGRGGPANTHIGNLNFRELVERTKLLYMACPNLHKRYVSLSIVKSIASQNPPGRFLLKDKESGKWSAFSEEEAVSKTCQALREKEIKQRPQTTHPNIEPISCNSYANSLYQRTMLFNEEEIAMLRFFYN